MTLAELNSAIRTEMQLDPGLITDAERLTFLNDCLADLGNMNVMEKQASLAFVNGRATLPNDFVDIIALFHNSRALRPAHTNNTSSGYALISPTLITIKPEITGSLVLWYSYSPPPLVNPTDRPDIPLGFDKLLVDYAVARAHRKNGNIGIYREYMSIYEQKKFELQHRLSRLESSRVTQVIDTEGMGGENIIDFFRR